MSLPELPEPTCFASINKQGDVTSTHKNRDAWRTNPLYTADQMRAYALQAMEALRRGRVALEWSGQLEQAEKIAKAMDQVRAAIEYFRLKSYNHAPTEPVQAVTPTSGNILVDAFNEVQALKQQPATTERKGPLSKDRIREVFLSHGFTVKEGQTDLKPYVYDAAYALIALVQPATERKGEPVATVRTIRGVTIGYLETRLPDGTPLYTSPQVPEDVQRDAERYRKIRQGSAWPCAFASHDAPEPLTGDDLDAAIDAARKGE